MTPQELKNSILQLAIQGKLVEQRPEEGTGEELYKQIQAEKTRLIKEGKIKKEKPLPPISEDEIPFEIPDSWKWVRLGHLSTIIGGYAFKSSDYVADGTRVIRISDFSEIGFVNSNIVRHKYDDSLAQFIIHRNDILLCMTGGTVGKSIFVSEVQEPMLVNQRVAKITSNILMAEYVYLIVTCPITQQIIQQRKNSTNDNISMEDITGFLVPLPPLKEQKRIVAKIEELLPLVEQYEKAYNQLEQLNKQFPDDMKKSILQLAIQGKLVEQRPEEGTGEELYKQIQAEKARLIKEGKIKKEKPLSPISEDEIPFEIPESWKWVRLKDVSTKIVDGDHNPPSGVPYKTEYLMLSAKNINNDEIVDIESARYLEKEVFLIENDRTRLDENDILLTIVGTLGRSCVYKGGMHLCFQRSVSVITTLMFNYYLKYYLDSDFIQFFMRTNSTGTAQKGFYLTQLERICVALPPLAEQKRIVAKIEELLPLCDLLTRKWA